MASPALFGISVAMSFVAWGAVAWHYIWPALKERPSAEVHSAPAWIQVYRIGSCGARCCIC
jgi:hypothetical protein